MRVFAGSTDDADTSHFSITMEVGATPKTLEGWLQPDDTLRIKLNDGLTAH